MILTTTYPRLAVYSIGMWTMGALAFTALGYYDGKLWVAGPAIVVVGTIAICVLQTLLFKHTPPPRRCDRST